MDMDIREALSEALIRTKRFIAEVNAIDVEKGGEPFDVERFVASIRWYETGMSGCTVASTEVDGDTFVQRYEPFGRVGVAVEDGHITATLYTVVKALWCGCDVNVLLADKNRATIAFCLDIISNVAERFDRKVTAQDVDDASKDVCMDRVVVLGSREFVAGYRDDMAHKICIPFGKTDVICLNEGLYAKASGRLHGMNLYADFECDGVRVTDIVDATARVNDAGDGHKTILLTKDKGDIEYFMRNIRSDIVAVNIIGAECELPNLSQYDFIRLRNFYV